MFLFEERDSYFMVNCHWFGKFDFQFQRIITWRFRWQFPELTVICLFPIKCTGVPQQRNFFNFTASRLSLGISIAMA